MAPNHIVESLMVKRRNDRRFAFVWIHRVTLLASLFLSLSNAGIAQEYSFKEAGPADEAYLFTPPGFDKPGKRVVADGDDVARLSIRVVDEATGKATCCRMNVVGPDGNFYQPEENRLTPYGFTGVWPNEGAKGNRAGKAPIRYLGWFFYSTGETTVAVPPGAVRVEVWKGFEYRPETRTVQVAAGDERAVELSLERTLPMAESRYYAGDPHIHITRSDDADEELILDLLEAAGIRYGSILAYNDPAGPYTGRMDTQDMPQRSLGAASIRTRGDYAMLSGQEYRSTTYGHLKLFLRDELALEGQDLNADFWPVYGRIGRETQQHGGYAVYAHGGYAQEVYADFVQGTVDAVELLQFGVFRGISLDDWYRMLNIGYRFPCTGASDYPACRFLGDCKTYVHHATKPSFPEWLRGMAEGRSFVTTGPMLLLEVDGQEPGARIEKDGEGPHRVQVRVRVNSEVAPISNVQLVVNGRVIDERTVPPDQRKGAWVELERAVELERSAWIAARSFSLSPLGSPDAEAHTNPVYVYVNGKAPYDQASLDALVEKLDGQIALHAKRDFAEKAQVLAYFQRSRDMLMAIRAADGQAAQPKGRDAAAQQRQQPQDVDLADPNLSAEFLKEFLKPLPAKEPAEALKNFETVGGFQMQLVAAEPLVNDPVSAAFDEDGNLYVAEMLDYPYKPQGGDKPLGRVRLLRDTDGDGTFDESHVFADELLWVSGVAPWKGGVFVAAAPDIWYCKDTDGDFRADVRRKVYTGFGTQNQQGMLNNLTMGLDHMIYGSTSVNGGVVRPADDPDAEGISIDRRDFRFDPVTGRFETISGTVQFGNTFDDWGNRFLCSESQPLLHPVLPQRYLERNPYLPVPSALENIAPGPVPIYRISPIERWRQIRSSRRIAKNERMATAAGASHHVIDAAAGVTVYRGGAYPKEYYGNIFIGCGQNNLIHRRVLEPSGVSFTSRRADENTEFIRSSDIWFRPVNFINAPDGTLWCLDMTREFLETIHIPLDVVAHLDLKSGRDHGRIYRIAPPGFEVPAPPRLSTASTAELVAALESPDGWWRDTAQRLIYERQDRAAVPALRRMLRDSGMPQARLHALWSLHGLDALQDEDISVALADGEGAIREHATRLAEPRLDRSGSILEKVLTLAADPELRVRFQVAFTLGESSNPRAAAALARITRADAGDRWMRTAVLSSSTHFAARLLAEFLDDREFLGSDTGATMVAQLAQVVGARNQRSQWQALLREVATHRNTKSNRPLQQRLVLVLGEALAGSGAHLQLDADAPPAATELIRELTREAKEIAEDSASSDAQRVQAVRLLSCMRFDDAAATLVRLLDPRQPQAVQAAAVRGLYGYAEPEVAQLLLTPWNEYGPAVRREVIQALLAREGRTLRYLQTAKNGEASVAEIEPARRDLLLKHSNPKLRALAQQLFGGDTRRAVADVIAAYQPAVKLPGNAARGQKVFQRDCMVCHRIGEQGHAIGPNLLSSPSADPETFLTHVLDPNRYVLPLYVQYQLIDTSGRVYTGMIASETATSITLTREEGASDTILRQNIDELESTGKSLMPEGFEKKITPAEMADLIAWLARAREQFTAESTDPNQVRDFGTLPGLIEPKSK